MCEIAYTLLSPLSMGLRKCIDNALIKKLNILLKIKYFAMKLLSNIYYQIVEINIFLVPYRDAF